MVAWIIARLKEPGTYKGLVQVLGAIGIVVSPEQMEQIIVGVLAVIGLINAGKKG